MTDGFVDKTMFTPVELDDAHGTWRYEPQHDITVFELALISHLFTKMTVAQTRIDWREYLTCERGFAIGPGDTAVPIAGLARHFKEI